MNGRKIIAVDNAKDAISALQKSGADARVRNLFKEPMSAKELSGVSVSSASILSEKLNPSEMRESGHDEATRRRQLPARVARPTPATLLSCPHTPIGPTTPSSFSRRVMDRQRNNAADAVVAITP